MNIRLHPLEFLVIFSFLNETFTDPLDQICKKLHGPLELIKCTMDDDPDQYTRTNTLQQVSLYYHPNQQQNDYFLERLFSFDAPILNLTFFAEPDFVKRIAKTNMMIYYNNTAASVMDGFEINKFKLVAKYPNMSPETFIEIGVRPVNLLVREKESLYD